MTNEQIMIFLGFSGWNFGDAILHLVLVWGALAVSLVFATILVTLFLRSVKHSKRDLFVPLLVALVFFSIPMFYLLIGANNFYDCKDISTTIQYQLDEHGRLTEGAGQSHQAVMLARFCRERKIGSNDWSEWKIMYVQKKP